MSFRDGVLDDVDRVFFPGSTDPTWSEFDSQREFKIVEWGYVPVSLEMPGGPPEKLFTAWCVWDEDTLKDRAIVQQQGLFLGSVRLHIATSWFKTEPRPEQIIYCRRLFPEPVETMLKGWRVIDVTEAESMYYIDLDKLIA
jgi:hypothetical protein